MDTRLVTDLKLAESDAWKTFRVAPVLATDQALDHLHSVQMVVDLEEGVEHEKLTDGIAEVQQFDCQIGCYQIVTVEFSYKNNTDDAANVPRRFNIRRLRGLQVYPYPRVYPTRPVPAGTGRGVPRVHAPRVRVGSGRCLTGTGLPVFTREK